MHAKTQSGEVLWKAGKFATFAWREAALFGEDSYDGPNQNEHIATRLFSAFQIGSIQVLLSAWIQTQFFPYIRAPPPIIIAISSDKAMMMMTTTMMILSVPSVGAWAVLFPTIGDF